MRLITKLILLCAAAIALAAATDDGVAPGPQAAASPDETGWPTSVIPPTASWAAVFSSSWR